MGECAEERKVRAGNEFFEIISSYIVPLLDTRGSLKIKYEATENKELISIKESADGKRTAFFYPKIGTKNEPSPFYCKIGIYSSLAVKKPAINILRELLKVTEYDYNMNFSVKRNYGKGKVRQIAYKSRTLDLAFELGMCQWIVGNPENAQVLHTIICRMIEWSGRTYEGKNVPFGIVIDFNENASEGAADYLHFLTNDNSAVFTDGIFTGILLDKTGKVLSFLTRNSNKFLKKTITKEVFAPYQFEDIAQCCDESRIGVIVLTNGEIMLIKDYAICFVKRGRKWICFDWNRVYSNLRKYFLVSGENDEKLIRKKIASIYCTMLDVSFAHTGGCLSLVLPEKEEKIDDIVKERIDLFAKGAELKTVKEESREKIEVLTYLLGSSANTMSSFFDIEKPLRKEILSLDGATVVSTDGNFYCAGSIVAVSGGSTGGGRTAAAKKLADFGVGIKISEDGYIEAYGLDLEKKNTQSSIIQLFKFK